MLQQSAVPSAQRSRKVAANAGQGPTKHKTDLDSGGTFKIASCAHDARPVRRQLDHHCDRVSQAVERSGARPFWTRKSFRCNLALSNARSGTVMVQPSAVGSSRTEGGLVLVRI